MVLRITKANPLKEYENGDKTKINFQEKHYIDGSRSRRGLVGSVLAY